MSEPVTIKEFSKRFMFGVVSIKYHVDDRRPDLKEYESKYKHFIVVRAFGTEYRWTFRTKYPYEELPYMDKGKKKRKINRR